MERYWFSKPMKNEVPYSEIEKKAMNGEFHEWNFEAFDFQENGYEDVLNEIKKYKAVDYLKYKDKRDKAEKAGKTADVEKWQAKMDDMVQKVYEIYMEKDILPIQYYSDFGVAEEIQKCISYNAKFDGNMVSCGAGVGTTLCNYLFPNIFDTPSAHDLDKKNARSLYEKFHNEEYLKRAIKFCFSYKDGCPVPTNVMGGLRLVGSAPTNFRPMNAKAVYERFCPEGGLIYDFCCVSGDTEFFCGNGWKPISEYVKGDKVLQYNEDGTAEMVEPEEYIHYKNNEPFYEYTGKMFNSCLTGNHDIVYRIRRRGHFGNTTGFSELKRIKQEAILDKDFDGRIPLCFNYTGEVVVDEVLLRLAIALQADGFIINKDLGKCGFNLLKSEKIERLSNLLYSRGCRFTSNVEYKDGKDWVSFDVWDSELVSIFNKDKTFPKCWYNLSKCCKDIIIDEVFHWDGSITSDNKRNYLIKEYRTTNKDNADFIQFILASSGISSGLNTTDYHEGHEIGDYMSYKNLYTVTVRNISQYSSYNGKVNKYKVVYDKDKYCFTVPSHNLILRRNNQIFITGNCGFGGRMLGALSSKKNFRYVGTDPCTETMYHLHQLGEYIEQVTGREDSYALYCCGSEVFKGPENSIDFAFSSPPYFNLEVYSDEETQCYNKFPELNQWLEGYVRETIKNIKHMLKPGRCYAVNIADFKVGGGSEVAYVDEWIRISTEEGMPLFDTVYLGVTARAGSAEQAAGELKKENILIFKNPL